jgi:peroxiredoxin
MLPFLINAASCLATSLLVLFFLKGSRSSRLLCMLSLLVQINLVLGEVPPVTIPAPKAQVEGLDLSGTFYDSTGGEVSLTDDDGRVMFLNFWATWCSPCRTEMPAMAELYEHFEQDGLSMFAVTEEPLEHVQNYLSTRRYPFTILHDTNGELTKRFKVRGLPTTFILDRKRHVIYSQMGGASWDAPTVIDLFRDALSE